MSAAPERTVTLSAEETAAFGASLAEGLGPGDVVIVSGDVGAGKTTLVRGACRALGVTGPMTSPTFVLARRYRGRLPVSHLDLYRVADLEGEDPGILDDHIDPDSVTFIEWATAAEPHLGGRPLRIRLLHGGGDRREIEVEGAALAEGDQ